MLEELNQRLRELDGTAGRRRPSTWQHHGSTGSMTSSNGSISYTSPQRLASNPTSYGHQPAPGHNMPLYQDTNAAATHFIPSTYQQPGMYSQSPPNPTYPPDQQQYLPQASTHTFNFNEPLTMPQHRPAFSAAPLHQFAAWSGYGGHAASNTLRDSEEEAAVPPEANPW